MCRAATVLIVVATTTGLFLTSTTTYLLSVGCEKDAPISRNIWKIRDTLCSVCQAIIGPRLLWIIASSKRQLNMMSSVLRSLSGQRTCTRATDFVNILSMDYLSRGNTYRPDLNKIGHAHLCSESEIVYNLVRRVIIAIKKRYHGVVPCTRSYPSYSIDNSRAIDNAKLELVCVWKHGYRFVSVDAFSDQAHDVESLLSLVVLEPPLIPFR